MRWFISVVILLFIPCFLFGITYYVDATDGDNGNTGLSSEQAWQTIAKINSTALSAGDSVLTIRNSNRNDIIFNCNIFLFPNIQITFIF